MSVEAKKERETKMCIGDAVGVLLSPIGFFDDARNGRFEWPNEVDGGLMCLFEHRDDHWYNTESVMATDAVHQATLKLKQALARLLEPRIDVGLALYAIHRALLDRAGGLVVCFTYVLAWMSAGITADERQKLQVESWRNWVGWVHVL